jgi:glyoxylase-like metal-dependent hydrolase (beta-lactamase superfamily II)
VDNYSQLLNIKNIKPLLQKNSQLINIYCVILKRNIKKGVFMKLNFLSLVTLFSILSTTILFATPAENIFKYKVGAYTVTLLVERRADSSKSILLGASNEMIEKYLPAKTMQSEVNTFLIQTDKNTVVVDTGFGGAIFENLAFLGVKPESVDSVLLTHMHGDHIGGLVKNNLPAFPNATVYLAKQEKNYWTTTSTQVQATLAVYGNKIKTFNPAEIDSKLTELLPGITPVAAFGHTPGHTLYLVSSGSEKLLIIADLVHAENIQIPVPQVAVTYDVDPGKAVKSREKIFKYVAKNKIPVAGMHMIFPAIGYIKKDGINTISKKEGYILSKENIK